MIEAYREHAERMSNALLHSLEAAMLASRCAQVQKTVEVIGQSPAITEIKIFSAEGRVAMASPSTLIGARLDKASLECRTCHAGSAASRILSERTRIFKDTQGESFLGTVTPIYLPADRFLEKPIDPGVLLEKVEKRLGE